MPRSGSASTSAQKTAVSKPTGLVSSASVRGTGRRARYSAVQIASAGFASSEGWKVTGPSWSQRLAPFTRLPATSASTSRKRLPRTSIGAMCLSVR